LKEDKSKISILNLSILRIAVYELEIEKKTPYQIVINEAINLSKKFN